ncbi:hypothetical protein Tco_0515181 [Tanacetum coccineum]
MLPENKLYSKQSEHLVRLSWATDNMSVRHDLSAYKKVIKGSSDICSKITKVNSAVESRDVSKEGGELEEQLLQPTTTALLLRCMFQVGVMIPTCSELIGLILFSLSSISIVTLRIRYCMSHTHGRALYWWKHKRAYLFQEALKWVEVKGYILNNFSPSPILAHKPVIMNLEYLEWKTYVRSSEDETYNQVLESVYASANG